MKKTILLLSVLLAAALAQEGEQARRELERTDRYIREAAPTIERSENREAIYLLNEARRVQVEAWDMYRQKRHRAAMSGTNRARDLVDRALRLARFDPERVRREIRRTAELMGDAGPRIRRSRNRRAMELWKVAQGEQETARRGFSAGQYLLALKFTNAARLHVGKALEIIRGGGDPERVRTEIERTDQLMERVRNRVRTSADSRLEELLARASGWQEQARAAFVQEQPLVALRLAFSARDLLLRTWEIGLGRPDSDMVAAAVEETDRLIEHWTPVVKEQGEEQVVSVFEQALKLQDQARQALAADDLGPALQQTSAARRMIARLVEQIESGPQGSD